MPELGWVFFPLYPDITAVLVHQPIGSLNDFERNRLSQEQRTGDSLPMALCLGVPLYSLGIAAESQPPSSWAASPTRGFLCLAMAAGARLPSCLPRRPCSRILSRSSGLTDAASLTRLVATRGQPSPESSPIFMVRARCWDGDTDTPGPSGRGTRADRMVDT